MIISLTLISDFRSRFFPLDIKCTGTYEFFTQKEQNDYSFNRRTTRVKNTTRSLADHTVLTAEIRKNSLELQESSQTKSEDWRFANRAKREIRKAIKQLDVETQHLKALRQYNPKRDRVAFDHGSQSCISCKCIAYDSYLLHKLESELEPLKTSLSIATILPTSLSKPHTPSIESAAIVAVHNDDEPLATRSATASSNRLLTSRKRSKTTLSSPPKLRRSKRRPISEQEDYTKIYEENLRRAHTTLKKICSLLGSGSKKRSGKRKKRAATATSAPPDKTALLTQELQKFAKQKLRALSRLLREIDFPSPVIDRFGDSLRGLVKESICNSTKKVLFNEHTLSTTELSQAYALNLSPQKKRVRIPISSPPKLHCGLQLTPPRDSNTLSQSPMANDQQMDLSPQDTGCAKASSKEPQTPLDQIITRDPFTFCTPDSASNKIADQYCKADFSNEPVYFGILPDTNGSSESDSGPESESGQE